MDPFTAFVLGALLGTSTSKSDESGADIVRRHESDMEALGMMFSVLAPAFAILTSIGAILLFGWTGVKYVGIAWLVIGTLWVLVIYPEKILATLVVLIARGLIFLFDPQVKNVKAGDMNCGRHDAMSNRLQGKIGDEPKPFVVDFQTSPLKDVLARYIFADALRFVVEMFEKSDYSNVWSAVGTAWEVAKEFLTGGKEIKVDFDYRKKLVVGSKKASWVPAVMYFNGYQFISFGEGSGIYEAFEAEHNPPVFEIQLPGRLTHEVVVYDTGEGYDDHVVVWDWK